jgi:hypothetical protein
MSAPVSDTPTAGQHPFKNPILEKVEMLKAFTEEVVTDLKSKVETAILEEDGQWSREQFLEKAPRGVISLPGKKLFPKGFRPHVILKSLHLVCSPLRIRRNKILPGNQNSHLGANSS